MLANPSEYLQRGDYYKLLKHGNGIILVQDVCRNSGFSGVGGGGVGHAFKQVHSQAHGKYEQGRIEYRLDCGVKCGVCSVRLSSRFASFVSLPLFLKIGDQRSSLGNPAPKRARRRLETDNGSDDADDDDT